MLKRIFRIIVLLGAFILAAGISGYVTLTLIIKSEDTVIIPDLTGKEIVYALELLSDLGLNTKVKGTDFDPQTPKNHILYQDPSPGAEIKKGRDVRLVLSKGPKSVQMPNLKGLSRQQARIILEENDLCLGNLSHIHHGNSRRDEIVSQFPNAGAKMIRGNCADLLISLGSPETAFMMPDFQGFPLEETLQAIETHQLFTGEVKRAENVGAIENSVLEQNPEAGYRVQNGTLVNLTINRLGKLRQLDTDSDTVFFRYQVETGFLNQQVRVKWNRSGYAVNLFEGLMRPGESIWLLIPKTPRSSIFLYVDEELVKTQVMD